MRDGQKERGYVCHFVDFFCAWLNLFESVRERERERRDGMQTVCPNDQLKWLTQTINPIDAHKRLIRKIPKQLLTTALASSSLLSFASDDNHFSSSLLLCASDDDHFSSSLLSCVSDDDHSIPSRSSPRRDNATQTWMGQGQLASGPFHWLFAQILRMRLSQTTSRRT